MTSALATAASLSLVRCPGCEKLHPAAQAESGCPRCGARLERRKTQSVQRTWALTLAAAALYVPSNIFPVMKIEQLGKTESDTILSGILALMAAGWYPIALAILFASILVPLFKLLGLSALLIAVQRRSQWRPRERTVLFRAIHMIGRWSMLDMFTTSLLVALVQLGGLMTIDPGIGATCFAGVVILTMLAAQGFDPRLVWDGMEDSR